MRNYFAWAVVVVAIVGSVVVQWLITEGELDRLDARIYGLQHDLELIAKARNKLPEIHDLQAEEKKTIQVLHKRIPSEPMVDSFLQNLTNHFEQHNIEIAVQSSEIKNHFFYNEIHLVINLGEKIQDHNLLTTIFQDIERYVKLTSSVPGEFTKLELRIYSSTLEMQDSVVHPCREIRREALKYWPFAHMVTARQENIQQLCAQRDSELGVLEEVKKLQGMGEYRTQLATVVLELNPDKGTGKPESGLDTDKAR